MADETGLLDFFKSYGEAFQDGIRLTKFYGDCAIASTPTFVGCIKGEAEIRAALLSVAKQQVSTGMRSVVPQKIEVSPVDSLHRWARVHWGATFEKTGDRLIEFDISYLVRQDGDRLSILLYVSHQDEEKMRRELGLT